MWTKTKTVAALLSMYIARGAANEIEELKFNRIRPHNRDASPASKAGKKVCLEYGFLNDVVAKGSRTLIGGAFKPTTASPILNGLLGDCVNSPLTAVCCEELAAAYTAKPYGPFDDTYECLSVPAKGPFFVGNWWLQRDVNYGHIFFEKGNVCGKITVGTDVPTDAVNLSKTTLELWDDKYIDKPLGLFKEFKVDYDFRVVKGGSGGYLNFYLRSAASNTNYYDCRFDFLIPNEVGRGTLAITPETRGSANPGSGSVNAANSCTGTGTTTIKDYLTANSGAVMGVGNGEKYAFVLNTGSTGQNNMNQVVCWSNVSIKIADAAGNIFVDTYEFTTL
jgi:hypothetical protein